MSRQSSETRTRSAYPGSVDPDVLPPRSQQSGEGFTNWVKQAAESVRHMTSQATEGARHMFNQADNEVDQAVDEHTMYGGWAPGSMKVANLRQRLQANQKAPDNDNFNRFRTFRATVDGQPLTSFGTITTTNKTTGVKTSKQGTRNRYFTGTPSAAAKKVVAQLQKGLNRKKGGPLPGSRNVTGLDKAVRIQLVEVTKGVRKADGTRFTHDYFGWREPLKTPVDTKRVDKNGQKVMASFKNIAVPSKGANSASQAYQTSKNRGAEIKHLKGLSEQERANIRGHKQANKKANQQAKKASKAKKSNQY